MPIIKSAKKRVKLAARARSRNNQTRRDVREALKAYAKALESGKSESIASAQREAFSALDTAAKKYVIHRNKAARMKSRLSSQAKTKGVKPTKTAVKKSAAKPSVKKTPAKKPAK